MLAANRDNLIHITTLRFCSPLLASFDSSHEATSLDSSLRIARARLSANQSHTIYEASRSTGCCIYWVAAWLVVGETLVLRERKDMSSER